MASPKSCRDENGKFIAVAWPGGYPMHYLTKGDTSDPVVAGDVYWEGPNIECEDCGGLIESAYGDPDEDEDEDEDEE